MAEPLRDLNLLSSLLSVERLGVFTDFDGTISPIAPRPEAAGASPAAKAALKALAERLPVVVAISGRALFDLRAKLDLPELLYIGSHGLTWWYQGADEVPDEVRPYIEYAARVAAELETLHAYPGIRFEEKGIGLALHYRQSPDPQAARAAILDAVAGAPTAQHFEVREGILVAELFPRVAVNKGTALRQVVERFALDGVIYFGDDLTDVDAMYAAKAMRELRSIPTVSVAVRHAEAPPLVAEAADYVVEGVPGVEAALTWLSERVPAPPPPLQAAPAPDPGIGELQSSTPQPAAIRPELGEGAGG